MRNVALRLPYATRTRVRTSRCRWSRSRWRPEVGVEKVGSGRQKRRAPSSRCRRVELTRDCSATECEPVTVRRSERYSSENQTCMKQTTEHAEVSGMCASDDETPATDARLVQRVADSLPVVVQQTPVHLQERQSPTSGRHE